MTSSDSRLPSNSRNASATLTSARHTLELEAQSILALKARLGTEFVRAVELILACQGRVIVCGLGKTGHIGRKIAATLASTGTPYFFLHAAEDVHGDIGMIGALVLLVAL
jgi:arabinose-5-phosphate isomerase